MGEKQKATMLGSMLVICNALEDMELDIWMFDMGIPEKVKKKIKKATKTMNEAYVIMHDELYGDAENR